MPDIFGAPAGLELAAQGRRAQQQHEQNLQKGELELEAAKMALESQKRMLELMTQDQTGPAGQKPSMISGADDLAGKMDRLAEIALASGLPEKAKDYATTGSTIRKNSIEITNKKLETDIKEMDLMSSLLQGVKDPISWQQANAMFLIQTGRQSPWARLPYHPSLVEKLQMGVASAKDRAQTAAAAARVEASKAEVKEREARVPLIRAQTRLAEERRRKLEKAGATSKIAKPADIRAISDLAAKDYPGYPPEDIRVLARPVAEEMQDLLKQGTLTHSQAAQTAYDRAKARGDFGGLKPRRPEKGTVANPLELPTDKTKLKKNMYYQKGGAKYLFTGTSFVPVGTGPGEITEEEADEEETFDEDTAPAYDPSEEEE